MTGKDWTIGIQGENEGDDPCTEARVRFHFGMGVAVTVWLRSHDNGSFGESWTFQKVCARFNGDRAWDVGKTDAIWMGDQIPDLLKEAPVKPAEIITRGEQRLDRRAFTADEFGKDE